MMRASEKCSRVTFIEVFSIEGDHYECYTA